MRSASNTAKFALPAAALLNFLKETRGATTWTVRDLTKTLKLSPAAAKEAIAILRMQGYVTSAGSKGEWVTTQAGEIVSGSKTPRYSRAAVEKSLAALADQLKRVNEDSSARYKIAEAVAFGDFLSDRVRVQAADIGIGLTARSPAAEIPREPAHQPPGERERQVTFLKHLRGRTPLLNILPYAEWMSVRTHRNLLPHSH